MAKSENQKLKILYLLQILQRETDNEHALTMAEIIAKLQEVGISSERKSIYSDLEALRSFGVDIEKTSGKSTAYYIASREFELPELKLLVDSVQSSKFLSERKSLSLIRKLEQLTSEHEAKQLQRQVYVQSRIKSMNEAIYYTVDSIYTAISENCKLSFHYFKYNLNKQREFRRNGTPYLISPFALICDSENYYMLGYDTEQEKMKHFRVDKMSSVKVTDLPREGNEVFAQTDMARYNRKVFGMFTGEEVNVRMRFSNDIVDVILDRFGKEIIIVPDGPDHFTTTTSIMLSPQFYGWVCALGSKAQVLAPPAAVQGMVDHLQDALRLYQDAAPES